MRDIIRLMLVSLEQVGDVMFSFVQTPLCLVHHRRLVAISLVIRLVMSSLSRVMGSSLNPFLRRAALIGASCSGDVLVLVHPSLISPTVSIIRMAGESFRLSGISVVLLLGGVKLGWNSLDGDALGLVRGIIRAVVVSLMVLIVVSMVMRLVMVSLSSSIVSASSVVLLHHRGIS